VYVRSRDPDGTLRGILVEDGRDPSAQATILAERGRMVAGPDGPRVLLLNGSREQIDQKTGRLNVLTFSQNDIDLTDNSNNGGERLRDMTEMATTKLLHPHPLNKADIPKWITEGHKRLSSPLTAVSYAFVALLSVLTGTFRRHGSYLRPLIAIGAMVGLLALGFAVESLSARDNALLPLMWLHAILPGVVCALLLLGPQVVEQYRYRLSPA
jgi:lipopolysaccharide export system permease protein